MPTSFNTSFTAGSVIADSYVKQYASPVNDLETGSSQYAADTGSTDAYSVTPMPVPPNPLTAGYKLTFKANTANTGACTLNVQPLVSNVAIKKASTRDLETGDIAADQLVTVVYDGTYFQLQGISAIPTTTKGDLVVHTGGGNSRLGVGVDGQVLVADSTQATGVKWASGAGGTALVDVSLTQGRLTLTSNDPTPTTPVTGASTLYFTPYLGNRIALYIGGAWDLRSFSQISLSLSGMTADKVYDVFAYWDSGTSAVLIERGAAWTNDTTRSTALDRQDGVWIKSGDPTRRYLGTLVATGPTTTEDSNEKSYLWNLTAIERRTAQNDPSPPAFWTVTSTTITPMNGGSNVWKHYFVCGLDLFPLFARTKFQCNSGGSIYRNYICMDGTTIQVGHHSAWAGGLITFGTDAQFYPGIGRHYLQGAERVDSGVATVYTDTGNTAYTGMFSVWGTW
jgi:hypothetical protein